MTLAWLLLITGLTISAVAIYYSVIGLAAIFAAAVVPIYIMGGSLEIAKLVCAVWLKTNWRRIPTLMRVYMTTAVLALMFITSMGIFGYLSKAHSEQAVPVGDNQAKIQILDERIAIEQEIIVQARQDIDVLNQQIERFTALGAVTRGVNARNQQREERQVLTQQIVQAQEKISGMRTERAPYAASLRVIEAEVGPIKYIAALVYGDNPDDNLLEKAVTWVIILIVAVFDPLAVIMLLSAQMSFQWLRDQKNSEAVPVQETPAPVLPERDLAAEANAKIAEIEKPEYDYAVPKTQIAPEKSLLEQHPYLSAGFGRQGKLEPMVYKAPIIEIATDTAAAEIVSKSVQEESVVAQPSDYLILPELEEESKKKNLHDQEVGTTDSQDQRVTYVQNEEQGETTLWQRLKQKDQMRAKDRLYKEYSDHEFKNITVDETTEPELFIFVKETQDKGPKFSNYDHDNLEHFAKRIYELRKD